VPQNTRTRTAVGAPAIACLTAPPTPPHVLAPQAGAHVVVKVLREQSGEALRSFLGEVNIWRRLRHPSVTALLGVCVFDAQPVRPHRPRPACPLIYTPGQHVAHAPHPPHSQWCLNTCLAARCMIYSTTRRLDAATCPPNSSHEYSPRLPQAWRICTQTVSCIAT
jgi:hypothetical protein